MNYKIGDKPKVKTLGKMKEQYEVDENDLFIGKIGENLSLVPQMRKYCGKKVTITEIVGSSYKIKEDKDYWYWRDWMFEGEV